LQKHEPWFDEGCSKLLGQRKQAKLQWLQVPSEINGDNLNNVRHEASKHFKNKKKEYLKVKTNELATNSNHKKIKDLHRGINEFKRGYQPRNNLVEDFFLVFPIYLQTLEIHSDTFSKWCVGKGRRVEEYSVAPLRNKRVKTLCGCREKRVQSKEKYKLRLTAKAYKLS
jgi:hypothetical protein